MKFPNITEKQSRAIFEKFVDRLLPTDKPDYLRGVCPLCYHYKGEDHPEGCGTSELVYNIKQKVFYCFECHTGGDAVCLVIRICKTTPRKAASYIEMLIKDQDEQSGEPQSDK